MIIMNEENVKNFDLNLLLTLHVILEERNVSRTAQRLNVSQSAISHALTRLRHAFDDPLFHRGSREMLPTPKAESLQAEIGLILSKVGQLVEPRVFDATRHSGVFRIVATDYGSLIIFPQLVRHLRLAAPNVRLECRGWSDQTLGQLESGIVDLVLGGQEPFPDFHHEPLFRDRLVLMVDDQHPLAARRKITLDEFVSFPHAVITVVSSRMKVIDDLLAAKGLARRITFKIEHFLSSPAIIRNSDLILTIPLVGAREMLTGTSTRLLPIPLKLSDYDYIQAWGDKQEAKPFHQWMRSAIRSICANRLL